MPSLHKRKNSPYWHCSFRAADGRWLKKSTKTKNRSEALRLCLAWEDAAAEARGGTLTTAQAQRVLDEMLIGSGNAPIQKYTIRTWLGEWLDGKRAARTSKTLKSYSHSVGAFLSGLGARAELPLRAIEPGDIRRFRDRELATGKSPVTVNQSHKTVGSAFEAARRMGYIPTNPATAVEFLPEHAEKIEKGTFTPEEVAKLAEAAESEDWKGAILVGYFTGLRLRDALGIKWGDVNLERGVLTVTPRKTARLGKRLAVPIHPELGEFLRGHPVGVGPRQPVFPTLAALVDDESGRASKRFKAIMKRAGVPAGVARSSKGGAGRSVASRSFHSFRHTYNHALEAGGVSLATRRKLVGHASDAQNLAYTHPDFEAMRDAVGKVPGLKGSAPGA